MIQVEKERENIRKLGNPVRADFFLGKATLGEWISEIRGDSS